MKKILAILVLSIAFSACKSGKTQASSTYATAFEDKAYQVISVEGRDVESMELDLRINTNQNTISGESGCNNYQFNYDLKEDTLDLGYAVATKMYCEETMKFENAFFSTTSKVKHFSQKEGMLYFYDENGNILLEAKEQNTKGK